PSRQGQPAQLVLLVAAARQRIPPSRFPLSSPGDNHLSHSLEYHTPLSCSSPRPVARFSPAAPSFLPPALAIEKIPCIVRFRPALTIIILHLEWRGGITMGFKQTATHRFGKASY